VKDVKKEFTGNGEKLEEVEGFAGGANFRNAGVLRQ
jgi:hypothetical protein